MAASSPSTSWSMTWGQQVSGLGHPVIVDGGRLDQQGHPGGDEVAEVALRAAGPCQSDVGVGAAERRGDAPGLVAQALARGTPAGA